MTYTVEIVNHALRSGNRCGTFNTIEEARESMKRQARRSRSFVEFHICPGTPRNPGERIPGETMKGEG